MNKKEMPGHLERLRAHYTGEDLMEEFNIGAQISDQFEKLSVEDD